MRVALQWHGESSPQPEVGDLEQAFLFVDQKILRFQVPSEDEGGV
jgi:hypothetical protein